MIPFSTINSIPISVNGSNFTLAFLRLFPMLILVQGQGQGQGQGQRAGASSYAFESLGKHRFRKFSNISANNNVSL